VATKPSFRAAFKRRRCLIVADGFYEWKKLDAKHKQPHHITMGGGEPFAFAGLWERFEKGDDPVESCTIITTDANDKMAELHDRMPVILASDDYGQWLDPNIADQASLQPLLNPCPDNWLAFRPVSTRVNNPRNESPECLESTAE
jgi:putative SOS response-associated peptidase YedK